VIRPLVPLVLVLVACGGGTEGRLVGTLFTNTCDWSGQEWLGVESVQVSLEYAPGALPDRSLPAGVQSCSLETRLFPEENRVEGEAIPRLDGEPRWELAGTDGRLDPATTGLWTDRNSPAGGCETVSDFAGDGLILREAGPLEGVRSPATGEAGLVYLDGSREDEWERTLQRGNPVEVSWTASGWDESFVQLRQVNGGQVRQVLTCTTTGLTSFRIDNGVWDQLDELGADTLELYVGHQNVGEARARGDDYEVITRQITALRQVRED
jgi:hypothetical protein